MTVAFTQTAQIVSPDYAYQKLNVSTMALTMDETWAPGTKATLTVPYTPSLELLNPEQADIVLDLTDVQHAGRALTLDELSTLHAGKTLDQLSTEHAGKTLDQLSNLYYWSFDGVAGALTPYTRTWRLMVREITIDYKEQTATLQCASPESRLQDYALVATAPFTPSLGWTPDGTDIPSHTQPYALATYVLGLIGEELLDCDHFSSSTTYWTTAQLAWSPGTTAFDYLYGLLKRYGFLLYCRYDGRYVLRFERFYGESGPALALNDATNLKTLQATRSRDHDYYTAVVVTYNWTDSAGTSQTAVDAYDSGARPINVYQTTRETPFPGAGVAQRIYNVMKQTARQLEATAIIDLANSWLSAPATLTTTAATKTGYIQAVEIQHPSDEMRVTIRQEA